MNKKHLKQAGQFFLLLVLSLTLGVISPIASFNEITAQAADSTIHTVSGGKWKTKSKKVFYINKKGKRTTGLAEIGNKKYYFDSKGVQRTGWQKVDGSYYFFNIANKASGYMVTNKTVNGIKLSKDGKAFTSGNAGSKLKVLVKAQKYVQKATKPTMTKREKLKACWNYMLKHTKYTGYEPFKKTSHWDQTYALKIFNNNKGTCFAMGSAFAYLANACGYPDCYTVEGDGHGWAEIKGKVYDPSWATTDKKHNYFGMSYSLSGKGGRRNFWKYRTYAIQI